MKSPTNSPSHTAQDSPPVWLCCFCYICKKLCRKYLVHLNVLNFRPVSSVQEVMTFVHYGLRRRHEDATKVHAHSSRSHLIVQLNLYHVTQASNTRVTSPDSLGPPPSPPATPTQSRRLLPQLSVEGVVPRKRSK